jgi:hypothetical protein
MLEMRVMKMKRRHSVEKVAGVVRGGRKCVARWGMKVERSLEVRLVVDWVEGLRKARKARRRRSKRVSLERSKAGSLARRRV